MESENFSAKGAECNSQGQVLSAAKRVAPGEASNFQKALKERHDVMIMETISHFQCYWIFALTVPGATRFAALGACPWLLHSAPLALQTLFLGAPNVI